MFSHPHELDTLSCKPERTHLADSTAVDSGDVAGIDVLDAKKFQLEKKVVPVWKTEVSSWGRVDDIRYAMPPLVVAATPYFGKNTKQRLFFNINVGDKRLQQLRSRENK